MKDIMYMYTYGCMYVYACITSTFVTPENLSVFIYLYRKDVKTNNNAEAVNSAHRNKNFKAGQRYVNAFE